MIVEHAVLEVKPEQAAAYEIALQDALPLIAVNTINAYIANKYTGKRRVS